MKTYLTLCFILITLTACGQRDWTGPTGKEPLPEKLKDIRQAITVANFPKENDPIQIKDRYYWKHATSILCKESAITIIEYGAYLFYDGKWNLRKSYPLKELDKTFGTKKQQLLQGEPYTWTNNWRTDTKPYGGWAMWYFIGKTANGETVCGYDTIHTTNHLLNN
ncbi:hypothetical protein [uncultured Dokdonia sp.]|uniref:hypothetical protein n=1 Tax=uncultured Dokdonia sp. TaxID=575653 RepID=UPI00261E804D|nr:hypothetical protein [uncultured Dokdonia sp.]